VTAALRRVHEPVATDVDADVADLAPRQPEEDQVSGPELAAPDRRCGRVLVGGRARYRDADLAMGIRDEAAAVEGVGSVAAVTVGRTEAGLRGAQQQLTRVRLGGRPGPGLIRRRRLAVPRHSVLERRAARRKEQQRG